MHTRSKLSKIWDFVTLDRFVWFTFFITFPNNAGARNVCVLRFAFYALTQWLQTEAWSFYEDNHISPEVKVSANEKSLHKSVDILAAFDWFFKVWVFP